MTLRTLNYGNYGIFLKMGNAGFCPSTVAVTTTTFGKCGKLLRCAEHIGTLDMTETILSLSGISGPCGLNGAPQLRLPQRSLLKTFPNTCSGSEHSRRSTSSSKSSQLFSFASTHVHAHACTQTHTETVTHPLTALALRPKGPKVPKGRKF